MYDIIGDIHGYASALEALLRKLGYAYSSTSGAWRHPEPGRRALFVGDYIDRGPEIPETLRLVRSMAEAGEAVALMGNHEFNAILFNTFDEEKGDYVRRRVSKNVNQHVATLLQFKGKEEEYRSHVDWFRELPLLYEDEHLRAVHACWDREKVSAFREQYAEEDDSLPAERFAEAGDRSKELYAITDDLLKGVEVPLPGGKSFRDKDGHEREEMRVRWWLDPEEVTFREWSLFRDLDGLSGADEPVDPELHPESWYEEDLKPVFFGHYWLRGEPSLQRSNVCCLDYSIAKDGKLAAYRFDGEDELRESKLYWV